MVLIALVRAPRVLIGFRRQPRVAIGVADEPKRVLYVEGTSGVRWKGHSGSHEDKTQANKFKHTHTSFVAQSFRKIGNVIRP